MSSELQPPQPSSSLIEHPLVIAASGEIPVVGAVTAMLVETMRARKERELYAFLTEVASRINALSKAQSAQLDVPHLATEEYAVTLANVTELAVREIDDDKRKYLNTFLVNYAKKQRPDTSLRKVFFGFIADLSGMHLVILDRVFAAQKSLSDGDLPVLAEQLDKPEALSIRSLAAQLHQSVELVDALCTVLETKGLVIRRDAPSHVGDTTSRLIMRPLTRSFMRFVSENA